VATLKELVRREELFTGGHRACAGCGFPVASKLALKAAKNPVVVACATGCMEVATTIYPYTAWNCSFIHSAFENAAASISGVEAAYRGLTRRGKLEGKFDFIAFGGDGGTYDIGFQALSGAMERGHNILYICYDNGAYMNTGIQRSSATPFGSHTTTTPAGRVSQGKKQTRKDLTAIIAAHDVPYAAQAIIGNWNDYVKKVEKALAVDGPAFINVLAPCRLGWGYRPEDTISIAQEAVQCCFWPAYEVENGKWRITIKPREKTPVVDWLKKQARFRHLFRPGNEQLLEEIQAEVDRKWAALLKRCEESAELSA
jgi:pyruvate ferredoxin oxidoreductase beta subunit